MRQRLLPMPWPRTSRFSGRGTISRSWHADAPCVCPSVASTRTGHGLRQLWMGHRVQHSAAYRQRQDLRPFRCFLLAFFPVAVEQPIKEPRRHSLSGAERVKAGVRQLEFHGKWENDAGNRAAANRVATKIDVEPECSLDGVGHF